MKKQEFICPKCGSNNWKVSLYVGLGSPQMQCNNCDYLGTFIVKEGGGLSKEDETILEEIEGKI